MSELDKNYIAGLYLDEITLDVMPQEYIDAALEVKLRYDACAPRAGYNCVQDRRVKGGFYYRKAPQGQGVNALPPSKLERALARSQEQPTQRSGLSFLSKAAIGAGVAIGGLALTGAVVNAGRSSEPYQEPVRQKPEKAKTSYNKPKPQEVDETITPQQSAQAPKVQPSKSPSSADLLMYSGSQGQKIAIPEGANFTGWKLHLNFGNGGENVTQEAYDKLTALGVPFKVGKSGSQTGKDATVYVGDPKKAKAIAAELSQLKGLKPLKGTDAEGNDIELAPGIGARFNVGAGNPEFQQYGRKGGVDLVDDVQNRIFDPNKNKSEAEINAGLQKDWENGDKALRAKFGDLYAGMMDSPKVEDPASSPAEKPNTAPAYIASKVSTLYGGQNTTRNGFEELDAIRGKKTLGAYSDEEIDNAIASSPIQKMQVKGKTYIRDLDKVDEGVLLNEAVNLRKASSKVNTIKAPEVRRLLEARDHKAANLSKKKDPTPEEKEAFSKLDKAVEEMRTAIGDREKNPVRSGKVRPEKKPPVVQEQKEAEKPAIAKPEVKADPQSAQKSKKELKEEESKRLASSIDAIANVNVTAQLRNTKKFSMADQEVFEEKASPEQKAKLSATIGKEIEKLGYDTPEGEELRGLHESLTGKKYVQAKPAESKAGAIEKEAASEKKTTNKGIPVTPPLAPNLSVENVDFKEPEYRGKEISNLSEAITKAKGSIPILVSQKDPIRYEAQGEISNLITYGASMAKDRDNETVRAFPYVLPKDKDIADAMLRQQDILYREPSDITPALSQSKIRGQASLTSSLDLENLVPTKSIDRYDPKTIESLAQDFTKVGGTIKPIVTIQKDPLSHEIVDGHLQYYAAKKAAEINPQYANIRSYPAEDMNHAEAIVAQYEAVRKAIAETDAVKAAVAPKAVRSPSNKPAKESPTSPPTTPPVTPAPKAASEANAAAVSKLSKKEAPVNEEENGSSTPIAPKVEDIAKIEGVYNSQIKDAESIGDKMLKANAIRNAFQDKERAIAALSNPPESPAPVDSQSSTSKASTSEKKPRSPRNKPVNTAASTASAAAVNTNKPAGSGKRSAIAEGLNLTAEDEARYASISGSTVSAGTLKGNEMLGRINTRMSFLQDQKKADRIEALRDKANKGEFVSQSDIDAVSIDFDGNYSPSDLKSEQAKSDISRAVSRLRLSEDVGEKPERRAKRMLLEVAGLASDPERLTSYLSSPQNYSAFKAGTKDDLNTVDYMSSQEKSQLESLIKNTFDTSAIAAYKRGENYSNKDLQRVYKDLTGKRLSFTAAQKKAADKAEQVNDAIAPSEEYLSAYYETRNKYRRVS